MTTLQIEKSASSSALALQERANAGGHLNADEIGKLLDANFPEPAFPDLAGQCGSRSKVPVTGSVEPVPPAAAISSPAPQPATKASRSKTRVTTSMIPLHEIKVASDRGPLNEEKVAELVASIGQNGLLQPPVVRRPAEDWWLVAGAHRLEALRHLGWKEVLCVIIESENSLHWELARIDENLIRNNLGPSEHAKLTQRREEIIKALAASEEESEKAPMSSVTQNVSSRKDTKGVRDAASVRDQAEKFGESREKIRRSRQRAKVLGTKILDKTQGTSLDKGVELDALIELPDKKRDELVERAAAGEVVTARAPTLTGSADPASPELLKDLELEQPTADLPDEINLRQALRAFRAWRSDFGKVLARWEPRLSEIEVEIEECI
jgi:ParB/RepB/Spo0J family partition protein